MYTNLNPRTMGMNHHPFPVLLDAAHASGFRGIEVPAGAFDTDEAAAQARTRMEDLGMRFGLIMAPTDMYKIPDSEFDSRENLAWHQERLSKIYHVLREEGILYGLEFMGAKTVRDSFRYPFIHSLMGILNLADSVSPEIGFVFDTIHWYTSGSRDDDLYFALSHLDRMVNLHLCCADSSRSREEQDDHH